MKQIIAICAALLIATTGFAQVPDKLSYQAVIRNSNDQLITNQTIGMQISILQGSVNGTAVYIETQSPSTNINGLVGIEVGAGSVISGTFSGIDWANGPYFIKTETDPNGGTSYSISGTSQLLSVPYALHAKTAEALSGGVTETDPVYSSSIASGITAIDTSNWNNKLSTEIDGSITNELQALSINNATISLSNGGLVKLPAEIDPVFSSSIASGITAVDTTNWNNKLNAEIDGSTTNELQALSISNDTISLSNGGLVKLPAEIDPVFSSSIASGITAVDTTNWNNKQNLLTAGTGIAITNNVVSIKNDFYIGQDTLGGIVYCVYRESDGTQHGLIVSKTETVTTWQSTMTITNALRTWDGVYNSNLMTSSPAKDWITNNFSSEWYLPSIDELVLLWHNRYHVNKALNNAGATLISGYDSHWSSTEYVSLPTNYAMYFIFETGQAIHGGKTNSYTVRAIRAF